MQVAAAGNLPVRITRRLSRRSTLTPGTDTRAAAAPLAGKGKQVSVVAVGALDAKEAVGEITTAQAVA